jgi:sulfate transport system ATP-binding protein
MSNGRAQIADIEVDARERGGADEVPGIAYVRPHDIEIRREPSDRMGVKSVINHISKRGAIVHLELNAEGNRELFDVELSREGFRALGLREGETVYAILRNPKIFFGAGV